MQRQERLRVKIDLLRERIKKLELMMRGMDGTDMNMQTLEPIAEQLYAVIFDVMGINNINTGDWNLGYALDYDKVLDYVMNPDCSINALEFSGLSMLQIPLDIIELWIQFIRIFLSLLPSTEGATIQSQQIEIVESTVNIMQNIVIAAEMKYIFTQQNYRDALSTFNEDIVTHVKKIIDPLLRAETILSNTFGRRMHMFHSFRIIIEFINITFIDKMKQHYSLVPPL